MIKRFAEYSKINESNSTYKFNVSIKGSESEATEFPKEFCDELHKYINFKEVYGYADDYETELTFIEVNDSHEAFALNFNWKHNNRKGNDGEWHPETGFKAYDDENEWDTEWIDVYELNLEQIGQDANETKEMMKKFKSLLRQKGVISTAVSVVLNVDGYADYVQTFDDRKSAEEFLNQWKDNWEIMDGTQMQGKRMGVIEEED